MVKSHKVTTIPWEIVWIDLVGPYTVTDRLNNDKILTAMTFVDPATGWSYIIQILDKTSARISQIFNKTWLARYPCLRKVIFDNGNEFKRDFLPLLRDFSIKPTPATIKNPYTNDILEHVLHASSILPIGRPSDWGSKEMWPRTMKERAVSR